MSSRRRRTPGSQSVASELTACEVERSIARRDEVGVDHRADAAVDLEHVAGMEVPVDDVAAAERARRDVAPDRLDAFDKSDRARVVVPQRLVDAVPVPADGQRRDEPLRPTRRVFRTGEADPRRVQLEELVDERVREPADRRAGNQVLDHEEQALGCNRLLLRDRPSGLRAQAIRQAHGHRALCLRRRLGVPLHDDPPAVGRGELVRAGLAARELTDESVRRSRRVREQSRGDGRVRRFGSGHVSSR